MDKMLRVPSLGSQSARVGTGKAWLGNGCSGQPEVLELRSVPYNGVN